MKKVWVNDKAYKYFKNIAKFRGESMLKSIDFIVDVFQQIPVHAVTVMPPREHKPYKTYRVAFYEQNKHKLEDHQREFFERNGTNMNAFFVQNKKELSSFRAAYALIHKNNSKGRLKKYNQEYYTKRRSSNGKNKQS